MSDSSVVVPPQTGTGIVTFDRGSHHGHHNHHNPTDWAQDWARTGERVTHDLAISDRFRAQEVRDAMACTADHGIRNLVSTKDLHLAIECHNGAMQKQLVQMQMEMQQRIHLDGDCTRALIRENEAKALAVELADTKAKLAACLAACGPPVR